ncbi:ABC transporter permease [Dyadobacter jiangsuensis]|uniref:Putative ABC transport system permease protein n=1 Tax=Dyadobacter jiangsuensis TaxID=1591085 RepID=A0A2P8G416_9BACT|nr:ABC transporter permease [Dyadobacter jiangsuensis]PSL28720.1 putative ABC transport system permease protein [Dyadobacter jiangsuensis]
MLKNYLKIAFRNLLNNKGYTAINVFGLGLGLATCLLIVLYVSDELSFDQHHRSADRLFRIAMESRNEKWAGTPGPVAAGLHSDFPEVESVARVLKFSGIDRMLLENRNGGQTTRFYENNGYYADSTLFDVLTYDFKYGNARQALSKPNTLILSEQVAEKLFGDVDPVGKVIRVGLTFGDFDYTVTGVYRNNQKSHIDARFILSMQNGDMGSWVAGQNNWAMNNIFHTYVKLREGTDPAAFESKLTPFLNRHGAADLKAVGISKELFIQPVTDIYLKSDIGNEIAPNGSMTYLYIFGSIAVFLLLIACINFMNLSTARSEKRAKEVGVRKVMGAVRNSLVYQFLGESMMLAVMGLAVAVLVVQLLLPYFNNLTGKTLDMFVHPAFLYWMAGITLFTGLVAGLYPAFYLSSFRPVSVLKGRLANVASAVLLRKGLVVFQFTVSIILILGAIVIGQQLSFLQNQNLGFDKEQKLVVPFRNEKATAHYNAFREEVLRIPGVETATSGSVYPGIENIEDLLFYAENKTVHDAVDIHFATVGDDYVETLGLKMAAGRSFTKAFSGDSSSIILNETAVREMGYDQASAIGKNVFFELGGKRRSLQVVGVVKDFNFRSLHEGIKPYALTTSITDKYQYFIANVKTRDYAGVLASVGAAWRKLNPDIPFAYSFLDQDFQKNYEKERRTGSIVLYFTCIAVVIACLGLFGLAAFSAERRTKEIGVRKVLGASVGSIVRMLSGEFLSLVCVALVIATPVAWIGMRAWLQGFAYQVGIQWWIFPVTGLLAILVALLTVGFQSVKAALMDPVKSLKGE